MFFSCKFDCHVDAFKAMIICTTPIQRILSQLQSVGLSTIKFKVSNNGNGMTNTAISPQEEPPQEPNNRMFRFQDLISPPFSLSSILSAAACSIFLEQPSISGLIERQPVRTSSLWP
jgi:hypothetical protein